MYKRKVSASSDENYQAPGNDVVFFLDENKYTKLDSLIEIFLVVWLGNKLHKTAVCLTESLWN